MVAATAAAATHVPPTSLRIYLTLWAPRCPPFSTRPKRRQRQQMSCPSSANLCALPAPVAVQLEQYRSKRFPARAKPATICCGCARTFSAGIACVQISSVNITRRSGEFICSNSCATVLSGFLPFSFSFPLQLVYSVAATNQSVACCGQGCVVGWQGAAGLLNLAVSAQGIRCDGALQQVLGHLYAASGKAQEVLR